MTPHARILCAWSMDKDNAQAHQGAVVNLVFD